MERFKVKALSHKGDEWIHGFLVSEAGRNNEIYFIENTESGESVRIKPETVCRNSGLECREGKPMYENDIIKLWGETLTVEYRNGCFGYIWPVDNGKFYSLGTNPNLEFWEYGKDSRVEIIGNRFDPAQKSES